jgi:hypothetical protein
VRKILIILTEINLLQQNVTLEDLNLSSDRIKKVISRLQKLELRVLGGFEGKYTDWSYL